MNRNDIKELLSTVHINGWNKIYRENEEVQNYLCSTYNFVPSTDKEIFMLFYCVNNDLDKIPTAHCGEVSKFIKYNKGFATFCNKYERSLKDKSCAICHAKIYDESIKKSKITNLQKYGTEIAQKSDIVKDKVKSTNIERYGVESHNQSEHIKEKKKKAIIKKYGVQSTSGLQSTKDKAKNTNLEKYGTEYYTQTDEYKERSKKTNLEKYGTVCPRGNSEVNEKARKNAIEKYGVDNYSKTQEYKERVKKTNLDRYGVEYRTQSPEFINKIKNSNSTIRFEKIYTKYSSDYEICFDDKFMVNKINSEKVFTFKCKSCGNVFKSRYNNEVKCTCKKLCGTSTPETELFEYIKSITTYPVISSDRNIIKPKELDILIPDLNIAFEFNGLYWHNTNFLPKEYHQNKTVLCKNKGIKLIHIFEDEWKHKSELIKERIKSSLGLSTKIYARKTEIRPIGKEISNNFIDLHHIQGSCSSSVQLGLYFNNELYAVMTFGKSRFNKEYEWELIRYCSKGTVVGGASKLLKYFERNYKPKSLISYADMNWSNGNLYSTIGFNYEGMTEPGYFYYDPVNEVRISRQKCQKHKLVKLGYDSNKTETIICTEDLGYYKIYDSGNLIYSKKY